MNELLFYAAIAATVLLLALWVPGLRDLALMILKGLGVLFGKILEHKGTFAIWIIKTLFSDHARVLRHMVTSKDRIDPTAKVRSER